MADAATTSETSDPLSCWRYDDENVMPFAAGPTQHQWTHSEAANTVIFVPQSHDMLLELHARLGVSLTHLRDYPRTAAEWTAQYQHLLGKLTKFDDATTLPPQSTWVLPTLQLDAARAFTVLDFCKWARSYKFERPRRLLVTDSNDPELRCLQQPSDRTVLLAFDKLTGSGDFHRPLPRTGHGSDSSVPDTRASAHSSPGFEPHVSCSLAWWISLHLSAIHQQAPRRSSAGVTTIPSSFYALHAVWACSGSGNNRV